MTKTKRKRSPRRRAFIASAILCGALLPLFMVATFLMQQEIDRQEESFQLTADYYACLPTQVAWVPLPELEEQIMRGLDAADIAYAHISAGSQMDYCLEYPALRPGVLYLRLIIPPGVVDDDAALGQRIEQVLQIIEPLSLEGVGRMSIQFIGDTNERHSLTWAMELEEVLWLLSEEVDSVQLFEAGERARY